MQKNIKPAAPQLRRPISDAQKRVLPLLPIFNACKAKGLPTDETSKERRLYAVNRYLCHFDGHGFDWIEASFKELLGTPAAIVVLADAIEGGLLAW